MEIDAETARLRRVAAEEERQRRLKDDEEERQLRKMLEAEQKEERKRQAEIEKETERLKRVFGDQTLPPRPHSGPSGQQFIPDRRQSAYLPGQASQQQYPTSWGSYNAGPYMSGAAPQSNFLSPNGQQQRLKNKSSIFSFRRSSESQDPNTLGRKRSAVF